MNYKEFLKRVLSDDETQHQFTLGEKVLYGVVAPLGFFAVMCLAGFFEHGCH